jgi:hypothetical protein
MRIDRVTVGIAACVVSILTALGTAYCDYRGFEHYTLKGQTHIHDLGYELIPQVDIPNIYRSILEVGWVPFAILNKNSVRVMTEISFVVAVVFMIRFVSMTLTILPSPVEKNHKFSLDKMSGGGVHDKVFSGHTALATIVALTLIRHGIWNSWAYAYPALTALYMIATRGHYSVDVFLGFVIAYLVYAVFYF